MFYQRTGDRIRQTTIGTTRLAQRADRLIVYYKAPAVLIRRVVIGLLRMGCIAKQRFLDKNYPYHDLSNYPGT